MAICVVNSDIHLSIKRPGKKIDLSLLTKPDSSKKTSISGGNNLMSHQNCARLSSFLCNAILWTKKCKLMLTYTTELKRANIQRFALISTEEITLNILYLSLFDRNIH